MLQRGDYQKIYMAAQINANPLGLSEIEKACAEALVFRPLYETVQNICRVPWPVIAVIHFRESSQNFQCHLHNGDPLDSWTVHEPKGRPDLGTPPYSWIESACDALCYRGGIPPQWGIGDCLKFLEHYNGLGYADHGVMSPYLWDLTDVYKGGLYVSDGTFNLGVRENRPGCVSLLKTLALKGISLDFSSLNSVNGPTFH